MHIKYLKSSPTASIGDIRDVDPLSARTLIILGYAEPYTDDDDAQADEPPTDDAQADEPINQDDQDELKPKAKKPKPKKSTD